MKEDAAESCWKKFKISPTFVNHLSKTFRRHWESSIPLCHQKMVSSCRLLCQGKTLWQNQKSLHLQQVLKAKKKSMFICLSDWDLKEKTVILFSYRASQRNKPLPQSQKTSFNISHNPANNQKEVFIKREKEEKDNTLKMTSTNKETIAEHDTQPFFKENITHSPQNTTIPITSGTCDEPKMQKTTSTTISSTTKNVTSKFLSQ